MGWGRGGGDEGRPSSGPSGHLPAQGTSPWHGVKDPGHAGPEGEGFGAGMRIATSPLGLLAMTEDGRGRVASGRTQFAPTGARGRGPSRAPAPTGCGDGRQGCRPYGRDGEGSRGPRKSPAKRVLRGRRRERPRVRRGAVAHGERCGRYEEGISRRIRCQPRRCRTCPTPRPRPRRRW